MTFSRLFPDEEPIEEGDTLHFFMVSLATLCPFAFLVNYPNHEMWCRDHWGGNMGEWWTCSVQLVGTAESPKDDFVLWPTELETAISKALTTTIRYGFSHRNVVE